LSNADNAHRLILSLLTMTVIYIIEADETNEKQLR